MKAKTIKDVRLNGEDIPTKKEVDIPEDVYKVWLNMGYIEDVKPTKNNTDKDGVQEQDSNPPESETNSNAAKEVKPPQEDGEKNGLQGKDSNPPPSGTSNRGRGKNGNKNTGK